MYMETTIRISENVKGSLDKLKLIEKESYNDIIELLLEDHLELDEKTKKELLEAETRVKKGGGVFHEEAKKRLGL